MKRTLLVACSLAAVALVAVACGSNSRKNVATMQPMKGEKYNTPGHLPIVRHNASRCLLGNPRQRAYGKVVGYRASSLTIKDYQR